MTTTIAIRAQTQLKLANVCGTCGVVLYIDGTCPFCKDDKKE